MRKLCLGATVFVLLGFAASHQSLASRPVARTITGCVIQGTLHSLSEAGVASASRKSPTVYPMTVDDLDLTPYEGKKIRVRGQLLPGDRFSADPESVKLLGPCDKESRKAISKPGRKCCSP
jgi:hypothetical protein